ncbi:Protein CBG28061 [Caenorhabditis briggsae]|uniref:Protein CBG28061 n=1 Tax=Caenorhabditis briggsae TaxID=6238 RepID=B6IGQ1_CAEBR|nr:Protein CBG28061 [Caenorhabditis briggsae]CAR99081.1 Protein CBG28061 [Caenorhabditis briggsae]
MDLESEKNEWPKPRRTSTRRIMGPSHSLSKKPQPLIFITEGIYRSARNTLVGPS